MRNNAAYLPENPIVYIIFPESIHNRASLRIFAPDLKERKNPSHGMKIIRLVERIYLSHEMNYFVSWDGFIYLVGWI